jgi:caffeoyl-CoA O-methyltransferase
MTVEFIDHSQSAQYVTEHSDHSSWTLSNIAAETEKLFPDQVRMLIHPVQAQFMKALVHLKNPRHILEIGCFTGYSAVAMAEAMSDECSIMTCELNPAYAQVARKHFDSR